MKVRLETRSLRFVPVTEDEMSMLWEMRRLVMRPIWRGISLDYEKQCQDAFFLPPPVPYTHQWIMTGDRRNGAFSLLESRHTITLDHLFIHHFFQGDGVGSYVVKMVVEKAHSNEQELIVRVHANNHRAIKFLNRWGFLETGIDNDMILMKN